MESGREKFEGFLVKTIKGSKAVKNLPGETPYFVMLFVKPEGDEVKKIEYSFANDREAISFKSRINKAHHDDSHRLKVAVSYSSIEESIETNIYRGETLAVLNGQIEGQPHEEVLFPYKG